MANNQYVNKVVYGSETLIDLTSDTIDAEHLIKNYTAHDRSGAPIVGSCEFDANTSDANATVSEILADKTAYVAGTKLTGTMPNRGAIVGTITTKSQEYTVQNGYHDGSGIVSIDSTEQAKIIANNIRSGVTILGVEGSYSGEQGQGQSKSATPYTTAQTVLPDSGYDYLTQVSIAAIAYVETDNAAGGKTATIGTVAPTP